MSKFKIPDTIVSPFCSFYIQNNNVIEQTSDNIINCCFELCDKNSYFCYNNCTDDCHQCDNMSKICKESCKANNHTGLEILKTCIVENKCNNYSSNIDKNCISKNKDKIIKCAKNKCKNNSNIDCINPVWDNYFNILGFSKNLEKKKSENYHLYFISLIIILFLIILFVEVFSKK